jgi:hypothetical protein
MLDKKEKNRSNKNISKISFLWNLEQKEHDALSKDRTKVYIDQKT